MVSTLLSRFIVRRSRAAAASGRGPSGHATHTGPTGSVHGPAQRPGGDGDHRRQDRAERRLRAGAGWLTAAPGRRRGAGAADSDRGRPDGGREHVEGRAAAAHDPRQHHAPRPPTAARRGARRGSAAGRATCVRGQPSEPSQAARAGAPASATQPQALVEQGLGERQPPVAERAERRALAPARACPAIAGNAPARPARPSSGASGQRSHAQTRRPECRSAGTPRSGASAASASSATPGAPGRAPARRRRRDASASPARSRRQPGDRAVARPRARASGERRRRPAAKPHGGGRDGSRRSIGARRARQRGAAQPARARLGDRAARRRDRRAASCERFAEVRESPAVARAGAQGARRARRSGLGAGPGAVARQRRQRACRCAVRSRRAWRRARG